MLQLPLYGKSCTDKRHSQITNIFYQTSAARIFSDWSMCFKKVEEPEQVEFIDSLKKLASENRVLKNKTLREFLQNLIILSRRLNKLSLL